MKRRLLCQEFWNRPWQPHGTGNPRLTGEDALEKTRSVCMNLSEARRNDSGQEASSLLTDGCLLFWDGV